MNTFTDFFRKIFHRPRQTTPSSQAMSFVAKAHEEMLAQHLQHAANWKYGKEKGWSADMEAGIIVFQFSGEQTGTTHFQVIGVYNEADKIFSWGWAQNSIPLSLRSHAVLAKQWGKTEQHPSFQTHSVQCSMEDAWNFAAVTRKLAGAASVYRGRVGSCYFFMTTDEVQIDVKSTTNVSPTTATVNNNPTQTHWAKGRQQNKW
ncbi:DUF6882 domain-containing protein [Undibacterium flavidum]|uniref:SCP domain-containing protein n=1 Tax=Undibacterium flavidum TaxID=2762297 RepID=A0ABR6YDC2_9BURK|nr:DUF6882 domain-containing protein [Undibacterium flavidum]MBC3874555.1 hypothetical protein [Undibacterium flavidum]